MSSDRRERGNFTAVNGTRVGRREVPPALDLLHCEMSYLDRFPGKIFFYCHVAPRKGGQTPIADMRQVYKNIDSLVRRRFEEKGLRLIQNVPRRWSLFAPNPGRPRPDALRGAAVNPGRAFGVVGLLA